MDKHIKEQYLNMLERLKNQTKNLAEDIEYFSKEEIVESINNIYKDELNNFKDMYL